MNYKDTLLLPNTAFPMRGNLLNNEAPRYKAWFEKDVYAKMKKNREGAESFTLHDGIPYATGHTHMGHAVNNIVKDIIIKENYFNGQSDCCTPGWECHGLPREKQVEKKVGWQAKKDYIESSEI